MKQFQIAKAKLEEISILETEIPPLEKGQVNLSIDHFAFTSNNITYAVLGEKFKYWDFFPTSEGFGVIPAWGFATVKSSNTEGMAVGDRFYGYFPMATNLIVEPEKINQFGFVDATLHRQALPSFYNFYERTKASNASPLEHSAMLFNPLFVTSFLLNEFFTENNFFTSTNIVLTSASSKTAIALAYILHHSKRTVKISGFTSESNLEFVESLGIYDQVFRYSDLAALEKEASCIIDFAGNKSFTLDLQEYLLANLKFCSVVGLSHWDKQDQKVSYPFKAELFFAPSYGAAKVKEWGMAEYKAKLQQQLEPFLEWTTSWLEIDLLSQDKISKTYINMLNGNVNPQHGIIMTLTKQ